MKYTFYSEPKSFNKNPHEEFFYDHRHFLPNHPSYQKVEVPDFASENAWKKFEVCHCCPELANTKIIDKIFNAPKTEIGQHLSDQCIYHLTGQLYPDPEILWDIFTLEVFIYRVINLPLDICIC